MAADPRVQAMKEAQKERRRAASEAAKARRKQATEERKQRERDAKVGVAAWPMSGDDPP